MPLGHDSEANSVQCPSNSASKKSSGFNVWSFLSACVVAATAVANVVATINSNNNNNLNNNNNNNNNQNTNNFNANANMNDNMNMNMIMVGGKKKKKKKRGADTTNKWLKQIMCSGLNAETGLGKFILRTATLSAGMELAAKLPTSSLDVDDVAEVLEKC